MQPECCPRISNLVVRALPLQLCDSAGSAHHHGCRQRSLHVDFLGPHGKLGFQDEREVFGGGLVVSVRGIVSAEIEVDLPQSAEFLLFEDRLGFVVM